jgi:hypothetical protein
MRFDPSTAPLFKPGKIRKRFLLFTGSSELKNKSGSFLSHPIVATLLLLIALLIFACIYTFCRGRIG